MGNHVSVRFRPPAPVPQPPLDTLLLQQTICGARLGYWTPAGWQGFHDERLIAPSAQITGGNPNLKPAVSHTSPLGVVWRRMPGFSASLDFYDRMKF
jgi:hypothetical protein